MPGVEHCADGFGANVSEVVKKRPAFIAESGLVQGRKFLRRAHLRPVVSASVEQCHSLIDELINFALDFQGGLAGGDLIAELCDPGVDFQKSFWVHNKHIACRPVWWLAR